MVLLFGVFFGLVQRCVHVLCVCMSQSGCRLGYSGSLGSSNVGLGPRKKGSPFARGSSVDVRAWRIFDLFQHCINRAVGYNDT